MPRDLISGAGVLWKSPSGRDDEMLEDCSGKQGNCYWTLVTQICVTGSENNGCVYVRLSLSSCEDLYTERDLSFHTAHRTGRDVLMKQTN